MSIAIESYRYRYPIRPRNSKPIRPRNSNRREYDSFSCKGTKYSVGAVCRATKANSRQVWDAVDLSRLRAGCSTLQVQAFQAYAECNFVASLMARLYLNCIVVVGCQLRAGCSTLQTQAFQAYTECNFLVMLMARLYLVCIASVGCG